jgi:hypothetical protein
MMRKQNLMKQADALLKAANCDAITGELKDRRYRHQRAKLRKYRDRARDQRKLLGLLRPASPVRTISVEGSSS